MRKLTAPLIIAGLVFGSVIGSASASPLSLSNPVGTTGSLATQAGFTIVIGGACPAGTHIGYEGKYCWPNYGHVCPYGTHLGYEGKYCWRNRY